MIKNILFDLGGVIVTLDPQQAIRRFEEIGLADAASRLDSYTQHGIFGDLELGKIDAEQFRGGISKLAGREVTHDECLYAWTGYCREVPQRNLDALLRLRSEGYRTVLVSNTNPFMMSWALGEDFDGCGHGLGHYFDAMYMSYKCGAMKPDPAFFQHVLKGESIAPCDALFLDDGLRNVASAEAMGIKSMLIENGSDWTNAIYEHLK